MGRLFEDTMLRDRTLVFRDREDAGSRLADMLVAYKNSSALITAIPAGGAAIGAVIAKKLNLGMELVIVRKIQFPYNTEAGFGAIDPDGEVVLNRVLVRQAGLRDQEIEDQTRKAQGLLRRRNRLFRSNRPFPDISGSTVIIADDGLASGYTMLSSIAFLKRRNPWVIVAAIPTGSALSIKLVLDKVDELYCPNIRTTFPFAVAEAYENWYDLTDDDVVEIMKGI